MYKHEQHHITPSSEGHKNDIQRRSTVGSRCMNYEPMGKSLRITTSPFVQDQGQLSILLIQISCQTFLAANRIPLYQVWNRSVVPSPRTWHLRPRTWHPRPQTWRPCPCANRRFRGAHQQSLVPCRDVHLQHLVSSQRLTRLVIPARRQSKPPLLVIKSSAFELTDKFVRIECKCRKRHKSVLLTPNSITAAIAQLLTASNETAYIAAQVLKTPALAAKSPRQSAAFISPVGFAPMGGRAANTRPEREIRPPTRCGFQRLPAPC